MSTLQKIVEARILKNRKPELLGLNPYIFNFEGDIYPEYIKNGNAVEHIETTVKYWCKGIGLDIGAIGDWCLRGAIPINIEYENFMGMSAMKLPDYKFDYVFSSHCLEHLEVPVKALHYWYKHIREGGVLFLYLPHPEMKYWLPQNCKKHKHSWFTHEMVDMVKDVGFKTVLHGHRDLYWSFPVVGVK